MGLASEKALKNFSIRDKYIFHSIIISDLELNLGVREADLLGMIFLYGFLNSDMKQECGSQ